MKYFLPLALLAVLFPGCGGYGDDVFIVDWFVDPVFGSDSAGNGTPSFPFRTITFTMTQAQSGDNIFLAGGTYSASSGETFPIGVKSNVLIQGDPANNGNGSTPVLVTGGGGYAVGGGTQSGSVVSTPFVMQTAAILSGIKITATGANAVGVVFDNNSGTVQNCTVTGNGADGIRLFRSANSTILNSVITGNTGSGIVVFDGAAPAITGNSITSNGVDGVKANDTSVPNLAGGNTLTGNTGVGLNNNTAASTIQASGNTWKASVQGATTSGTYSAMLQPGPVPYVGLNNYAITNASPAAIQF